MMKRTFKKVYTYECQAYTPNGLVKMRWRSTISPDTKNCQPKLETEAESVTKFPFRAFSLVAEEENVKIDAPDALLLNN